MTPGTRLGGYEIIASIGVGGMGQVFRARDSRLNRDVALKILPDAFASDPGRTAAHGQPLEIERCSHQRSEPEVDEVTGRHIAPVGTAFDEHGLLAGGERPDDDLRVIPPLRAF